MFHPNPTTIRESPSVGLPLDSVCNPSYPAPFKRRKLPSGAEDHMEVNPRLGSKRALNPFVAQLSPGSENSRSESTDSEDWAYKQGMSYSDEHLTIREKQTNLSDKMAI